MPNLRPFLRLEPNLPARAQSGPRASSARRPGDGELIINTKTYEVPGNGVLECLELGRILGCTDQFDAGRRSFELTHPEVELQSPPSSVRSVFTVSKWLTSCLM